LTQWQTTYIRNTGDMYINLFIQCGRQSPGEEWETVKEFEDRGSGIGIMTRVIEGGQQLLVEFKTEGIVWRRTLFAVVLPAEAGARTIFDPTQYSIALSTIESFYHAETQGREPCMYISTLAGTRYITQSQGIAVLAFENEQQALIRSSADTSLLDMAKDMLLYTEDEDDDQSSDIGSLGWLHPGDIDTSAFDNWSDDNDQEPSNP